MPVFTITQPSKISSTLALHDALSAFATSWVVRHGMDGHQGQRAIGMDDPFRLHEGVGRLVAHREPRQRPAALADHHAGIDLEAILGLPGVGAFLALELGDVQRHATCRLALQQLDVVGHVVLVGLEADAARLDAFRRQVEAELQQPGGGASGSERVRER